MPSPLTIFVGQTASPIYQEWSGTNGTGTALPPAGPVSYASDNTAAGTVDATSGAFTAVGAGTTNVTATDSTNSLSASFQFIVQTQAVVAQSATLDYTIDAQGTATPNKANSVAGTIKKL